MPSLALMSTPTVGLSRMRTRGLRRHPLGEDDALLVAAGQRLHRHSPDWTTLMARSRIHCLRPSSRGARDWIRPKRPGELVENGDDDVGADRLLEHEAEREAVLRHVGDAVLDRLAVAARSGPACRRRGSSPRIGLGHAEQRQRQLGAAGAEQAGDAEDLAGVDRRSSRPRSRPARVRCATDRRPAACPAGSPSSVVAEGLAGHQRRRASCRSSRAAVEGADLAAVAEHGDALGDLQHLVEAVARRTRWRCPSP